MADESVGETILHLIPRNRKTLQAIESPKNVNRLIDISYSPSKALRLSFTVPPRRVEDGFIFGTHRKCDIFLESRSVDERHFCITFNPVSGIPLIKNGSPAGILVGNKDLTNRMESKVIEQNIYITVAGFSFTAHVPDRGQFQTAYAAHLGTYLGYMLTATTAVIMKAYASPIQTRKRVGPFLEIQNVGSGGFGEVCLFTDGRTGMIYAAKRFRDPRNIEAISREVDKLEKLSHRNIVGFEGCIRDHDGSLCLIMEYLPYGHLREYLVPEHSSVEILNQCLDGLVYIHKYGIIHRDIKPDNVVLKSIVPVHACLIDFGIATEGTQSPNVTGAVAFIAPEVWGGSQVTPVYDIWSLGLTALVLFAVFPHQESQNFALNQTQSQLQVYVTAILRAASSPAPEIARFLQGMLDPNPEMRWPARECRRRILKVQQFVSSRPSRCPGQPAHINLTSPQPREPAGPRRMI